MVHDRLGVKRRSEAAEDLRKDGDLLRPLDSSSVREMVVLRASALVGRDICRREMLVLSIFDAVRPAPAATRRLRTAAALNIGPDRPRPSTGSVRTAVDFYFGHDTPRSGRGVFVPQTSSTTRRRRPAGRREVFVPPAPHAPHRPIPTLRLVCRGLVRQYTDPSTGRKEPFLRRRPPETSPRQE